MGLTAQSSHRRIGVFGGTFDPVHSGHIEVAQFALKAASLDVVLMAPAGDPWLRDEAPTASAQDRANMVELAVEDLEKVELSRVDVDRPGETYTADTLADLRAVYGEQATLVLVLGADSALGMDEWKRADELMEGFEIVAIGRPGEAWPGDLPGDHPAARAVFFEGPMIDISATEIRRRLSSGEPTRGILPEKVGRYIREHGLYGVSGDRERG